MKITVLLSPRGCTGVTTISNYLLNAIVQPNSKETALLIEFSKSTGKTVYLNYNTLERNKCLSNTVINTYLLKENLCKSKYNKNCFYLCQNINNKITDLESYPLDCISSIIDEVRKTTPMSHIIIDLPSYLLEKCRLYVLSKKFKYQIDNMFLVLDEDALTFKSLKDMSELASLYDDTKHYCTYVVNKTTEHYVDYIDNYSGAGFPSINLIKLPYISDMNDISNRGTIYNMGKDKTFEEFQNGISKMVSIIHNKEAGYGLNFDNDTVEELTHEGFSLVRSDSEPNKVVALKPKQKSKFKLGKKSKSKEAEEDNDLQIEGINLNSNAKDIELDEITFEASVEPVEDVPVEDEAIDEPVEDEDIEVEAPKSKRKGRGLKEKSRTPREKKPKKKNKSDPIIDDFSEEPDKNKKPQKRSLFKNKK